MMSLSSSEIENLTDTCSISNLDLDSDLLWTLESSLSE